MKRRELLKRTGSLGIATTGLAASFAGVASAKEIVHEYEVESGSTDSAWDAKMRVFDTDTSDNSRAGEVWAEADVDNSGLKREKVEVVLLEERCNSGGCSWSERARAVAQTGELNTSGPETDSAHDAQTWNLDTCCSSSNDRYRVDITYTLKYDPADDYSDIGCEDGGGDTDCVNTYTKGPYTF